MYFDQRYQVQVTKFLTEFASVWNRFGIGLKSVWVSFEVVCGWFGESFYIVFSVFRIGLGSIWH